RARNADHPGGDRVRRALEPPVVERQRRRGREPAGDRRQQRRRAAGGQRVRRAAGRRWRGPARRPVGAVEATRETGRPQDAPFRYAAPAASYITESVAPPSTRIVWPLTWRAWREARKTTIAATSSASPTRPTGMRRARSSRISSKLRPAARACASMTERMRSVKVLPGPTLFTVMPSGPSSRDSVLARPVVASRTLFERIRPSIGSFTVVDVILITRAWSDLRSQGSASRTA